MRHKMRNAGRLAVLLAVSVSMARAEDLVRWVDPLVGTVGEGNTFPGSCYPFGLVQASPDTGDRVTCSGYKHTDTTIRGFSQTHLNGTGRPAMGDLSLMPFVGDFDETLPRPHLVRRRDLAARRVVALHVPGGREAEAPRGRGGDADATVQHEVRAARPRV